MIRFANPKCSLRGARPELVLALVAIADVYTLAGAVCLVNHVTDGEHREHSFHYNGLAADLATDHLDDEALQDILAYLPTIVVPHLQYQHFDRGGPNEHLHIEIDHPLDRPLHRSDSRRVMP